jgi:hypothetical protein
VEVTTAWHEDLETGGSPSSGQITEFHLMLTMSTHANAQELLAWIRGRTSATLSEVVASGLMKSRTASDAIQYAVRNGALERVFRSGASAKQRVQYRMTGIPLPVPQTQIGPSFDGLLEAWGITLEPITLRVIDARRHQISDHE